MKNTTNILSVNTIQQDFIENLFQITNKIKDRLTNNEKIKDLDGYILGSLFFEPSTRTRFSFESAMYRLGGNVVSISNNDSSLEKGESLEDMGRIVSSYCDIITIRHPEAHSVEKFAKTSTVPIINAGDGPNQHPTQALLDLYTIQSKKNLNNLTIGFLGDLKFGRTVHSLVKLLKFYKINFVFIANEKIQIPNSIINDIKESNSTFKLTSSLNDEIPNLDCLYVTRVQKERFESLEEYNKLKKLYYITEETLINAKKDLMLLHPLPRVHEIDPAVDTDSRAHYFQQSQNGLFIRMALLKLVLGMQ